MWALFLVAFFTFLRKSNLVPDVANRISSKVPLQADLVFDSHGATLHIAASKTIQYQQRSLSIPLPLIPGSPLRPVTALRHYLRLNSGPSTAPSFSVVCSTSQQLSPLTSRHFCLFISKVISAIGLVPANYSPHSFRCGGTSFAFILIKLMRNCREGLNNFCINSLILLLSRITVTRLSQGISK